MIVLELVLALVAGTAGGILFGFLLLRPYIIYKLHKREFSRVF